MNTSWNKSEENSERSLRGTMLGILVLLAGLMLVDVLPNMLKSIYADISQRLVFSYGLFAFSAMGILLFFVLIGVIRDLPAFVEAKAQFGWRTQEAYFSGRPKRTKDEKK